MIYVMSDIHGCYEEYMMMLERISFSSHDTLYIVGDIVDRGPDSMRLIFDMMKRKNIIPILGNHDYEAFRVLQCFEGIDASRENIRLKMEAQKKTEILDYLDDGGEPTLKQFLSLTVDSRKMVLDYLSSFWLYKFIEVNGRKFLLTHSGMDYYKRNVPVDKLDVIDFTFSKTDYTKVYFKDIILVSGHTPTNVIDEDFRGKIYYKYNHLAIDCGCYFTHILGCVCLNNLQQYYVQKIG